jgi:hypothetical protein
LHKALIWTGIIVLVPLVYNLDAIYGQWKFDRLCQQEGGSRFYGKVEKDVGWEVELRETSDYKVPFDIGNVAFVRFIDKTGVQRDVHLKPGPTPWLKDYEVTTADLAKQPRYRLTMTQSHLPDDDRMSRTRDVISDIRTGRPIATYTWFSYQWAKPERVILNASTSVTCHGGKEAQQFDSEIFQEKK